MKQTISVKMPGWSGWILVPLRLFLGVTFVYAGVQKLTDPQYFNPAARGYIGHQIAAFALGSPLRGFLTNVAVPHATFFGALVAYGELAIGLGVLLGFLLRPATFFGLLINLTFFLSADWHVFPYFYGSDLVYAFCWLTLLLAGPTMQILPALDTRLALRLVNRAEPAKKPQRAALCTWLLGVKIGLNAITMRQFMQAGQQPGFAPQQPIYPQQPRFVPQQHLPLSQSTSSFKALPLEQARQQSRRNFVWGTVSGGAAMLVLAWLAETFHLLPGSAANANDLNPAQVTPTLGSPVAGTTSTTTLPNGVIARINSIPTNSSVNFTLSSNGDPGILIHLSNGQFVAFDATCTHAGCPVDYDPSSRELICPCHGAAFDPAKAAAVLNGPAQTPLTSVPIKVDQSAGTISLS